MPITDVLQMMGRAGRPQFDDHGVACVFVHDVKKHFYKKFLYEPFPVESSLMGVLPDHLNAEIVAGTIGTKQEALDYMTWTYFFRRLVQNPSYYGLEGEFFKREKASARASSDRFFVAVNKSKSTTTYSEPNPKASFQLPKNSKRIPKEIPNKSPQNPQKIPKKSPKISPKNSKKFPKNSRITQKSSTALTTYLKISDSRL